MGLSKLVKSKGFKTFMSRLYGFGASIVILGALFKINHYQGADIMLILGLGTESIIFFFSAFETPPVEPDWSLVHPELAHLYHPGIEGVRATGRPIQKHGSVTQDLDNMLAEAKIGPDLIQSLGEGLRKFSDNATRMNTLSSAAVATDEFVNNLKTATASVSKLSESSSKASEILDQDAEATKDFVTNVRSASEKVTNLSNVYSEVSDSMRSDLNATAEFSEAVKQATQSANTLSKNYSESAEQIAKSVELLDLTKIDGDDYNAQLKKISGNLAALNTVYEIQLNGLNEQIDTSSKLQGSVNQFLSNINETSEFMNQYREEVNALTQRISALNSVYGNMLAAMNVSQK
jgi:gliding motility-associated protein GldL